MKKLLAALLAVMMIVSLPIVASAEHTTTLTTTVPDAEYTLNIPANQEIAFGATETKIGDVKVTNSAGFAEGKNLKVVVSYDSFMSDGVSTTIPFAVGFYASYFGGGNYGPADDLSLANGGALTFIGLDDTTVTTYPQNYPVEYRGMYISINSEDWGLALAGDYTATITFTAEVVIEE